MWSTASKKLQKERAQPPQILAMTATGGTLLLPEVQLDQAVEIQFGYKFKGKWKPARVVERLSGHPVCVTVDGLKTSKSYVFRVRHQIDTEIGTVWGEWSVASHTGKTSANLGAVVTAEVLATRLAARHREHTGGNSGTEPAPMSLGSASADTGVRQRRLARSNETQRESDLAALMALGFHAALCEEALDRNGGNVEVAAEDLSSHAASSATALAAGTPKVGRYLLAPEEGEPPPSEQVAEGVPESTLRPHPHENSNQARHEQVPLSQDQQWWFTWRRLHRRGKHDAERLRELMPLVVLIMCTVYVEVQLLSLKGLAYFAVAGRDLLRGDPATATLWTPYVSAVVWLAVLVQKLVGVGNSVDHASGETSLASDWIRCAWSVSCASLQWVAVLFQWRPEDPARVVDGHVEVKDVASETHSREESSASSIDDPLAMWQQVWVNHPAGTFWYDHWIATVLATCVIAISCCSLFYSFLQTEIGIARLVRRTLWAIRYWLKAIIFGSLASLVVRVGVQEYWLQSEYVLGYCMLWLGSVLGVATLDAFSDALGRPSTFTNDRVLILFASIFMIGLPVLFWTAAHGIGWWFVSPVAFGVAVDGFGRAFLSEPLRDFAYLPIRLLSLLAEWVETTILSALKNLLQLFLRSHLLARVLNAVVASRVAFGTGSGSIYILVRGLEQVGQCQTWADRSCVVGSACACIGISGMLAATEMLSKDNNGRSRTPVFCTAFAATSASVALLLTVALPRSIQWVNRSVSQCGVCVAMKVVAAARYIQLIRLLQLARTGLYRVARAGFACWRVVHEVVAQLWSVAHNIARALSGALCRFASVVWNWICHVASATWRGVCGFVGRMWRVSYPVRRMIGTTWRNIAYFGVELRNVTARIGLSAWRPFKHLLAVLSRMLQQFTRAYWRLLPTGLAVHSCIRFGLAILRSPAPAASAALGFALASFAVGIIAVILVRDLLQRTFAWSSSSNRQYIATDHTSVYYDQQSTVDGMLVYVDLGAVAATRWVISNAGSIVRLLIEHGVARLAHALTWVVRKGWQVAQLIYEWVGLPVVKIVKAIIIVIWDSPVLSSATALGSLWLLWAHHSGTWRWHLLQHIFVTSTACSARVLEATVELVLTCVEATIEASYEWTSWGATLIMIVLNNTTEQLVAAAEAGDIESPRLAWVVWIVIVAATKSQSEIRLKTLMWPFVVLWVTAMMGGAQRLPQVMIGVLCWCGAAACVRNYEQRERNRVQRNWAAHRHQFQRRARPATVQQAQQPLRPTGRAKEPKFKDQTECSICLEALRHKQTEATVASEAAAPMEQDAIGMLPCGHCFHSDCIGHWLQQEARCPLCRQAAHGIDRVLEIMF